MSSFVSVHAFLFLFVSSAHAGVRVSGGGHSVVCRDERSGSTSHTLLDLYEEEFLRNRKVALPPDGAFSDPNLRTIEKARILNGRLQRLSPLRARWYGRELSDFYRELSQFTSLKLSPIDDSRHQVLHENCALEQAATQQERGMVGEPLYLIDQRVWDAFSLNNRAALLMHEIIYNELLLYGHTDSVAARRLLGRLASDNLADLTPMSFIALLHSAKIPDTDVGGIWMRLWDFENDENPYRSAKIDLYDADSIRGVRGEAYANFEQSPYALASIFAQLRDHLPYYEVRETRLKVVSDHSAHRLPLYVGLNHKQEVIEVSVPETNSPATLWLQTTNGSWQKARRLLWDDAGNLISAQ